MSEHTPRSYGDMVMNDYLKGLAEIAKEHPSKIEQLEALEKAATAGPWEEPCLWDESGLTDNAVRQKFVPGVTWKHDTDDICTFPKALANRANARLVPAARNALPALLAVAKAAKCYTNADPMVRGEAYRDLCEALSRLEAQ